MSGSDQATASMRARIDRASTEVEELTEARQLAVARRNAAIIEALESGVGSRVVADWARLSQARVAGILAEI